MSDLNVTGTVTYDKESKTLTLNNATIKTTPRAGVTSLVFAIDNTGVQGLTILLKGDNVIEPLVIPGSGSSSQPPKLCGIRLYENTTIKGDGSLTIRTNKQATEDCAIILMRTTTLTVEECHLIITAKDYAIDGGQLTRTPLVIKKAKVEMGVEASTGLAIRRTPVISLDNVKISEPVGGKLEGEMIKDKNDNADLKSIKLVPIPTGIALAPASPKELAIKETLQLTAIISPKYVENKEVTYTVKDGKTDIVTVSADGLVTAIGPGKATIEAKPVEGTAAPAEIEITVIQPVTGITLDKQEATLKPSEELQLTATVAPDNASDKSLEWSSSEKDIASVDQTGKVTAHTSGTATITVKNTPSGKSATCTITVAKEEKEEAEEPEEDKVDKKKQGGSKALDTPVSKPEASPYTIAPNPSQGIIFISDLTEPATIHVYSLLGEQLIAIQRASSGSIDLSFLPKGQYIIQINGIPHRLTLN